MATKKLPKNRIVAIALIVFTIYVIISLVWIHNDKKERQAELAQVENQIEEQTVVNQEMQDLLDKGIDDSYIIKQARELLNFVFPNEKVYKDVTGK